MARQIIVLALVFVAIVGLVSAQSPAPAPKSSTKTSAASAPVTSTSTTPGAPKASTKPPSSDDDIGATDGPSGDLAVEAPLGGPLSEDAFGPSSDEKRPSNGAATLQVSAIAGVAAVAGFFF